MAVIVPTFGWALAFGAAVTADRAVDQSGAPEVFALMFGWVYAIAWFLPHLALYRAIRWGLRTFRPATPIAKPPSSKPD